MKVEAVALRPGNIIEYNNSLYRVVKVNHMKKGRGGAIMQIELKDIINGNKMNESFRSDATYERVVLDEQEYQYLYDENDSIVVMDMQSFDQVYLPKDLIGEDIVYLQDNMNITVHSHNEKPVSITLPDYVTLEITEAEPVVKGQTAASSYKPAILENGVRVLVPPFIENGERIVVRTSDSTYVERAKEEHKS